MGKQEPCVLLTGATGFLGKVVLEELMRWKAQGDVPNHRIILLIRDTAKLDAHDRFRKLAQSKCFSKLEAGWTNSVEFVTGDLTSKCCGLEPDVLADISQRVTHIIHCAASIDFCLPIAEAAASNVSTCLNILELAENCTNLQQMVDVSTAYVHAWQPGRISEKLVDLPRPADELYASILAGEINEKELLQSTGHPNTYTITKCIAEHFVNRHAERLPITILRPSIISAAWKYPFPAWLDSRAALGGFAALYGAGFIHVLEGSLSNIYDVVPVDEVAKHIILESNLPTFEITPATEQKTPHTLKIVHSVAGRKDGMLASDMLSLSLKYFGENVVVRAPYWKYMGPKCLKYYWYKITTQTVPLFFANLFYTLTRNQTMKKRVSMVRRGIIMIDTCFPYFCLNTFDFDRSYDLAEDFTYKKYITVVCEGVRKHLLLGER